MAVKSLANPTLRRAARQFVAYFLLAFALGRATLSYGRRVAEGGDPWMTGDWLINYGGGFVRRGLFGELFLNLAPTGMPGMWWLFGIQLGLYAITLTFLLAVLHRSDYSWSSIALVCGPAGLTFIGWDIDGGFRKEILTFASLALLAWARWAHGRVVPVVLTLLGVALFTLGVLSWEATILLLPAALYLLVSRPEQGLVIFRRSAAAVLAAVSAVGGVLSVRYHGDPGTWVLICEHARSFGHGGPMLCASADAGGGAIEAIGWTDEKALADVAAAYPLYLGYLPLMALAVLPVVLSRWFRANWGWALALAVTMVPMYLVVTDYGRWTHMLVLGLTFCVVGHDPHDAESRFWNPLVTILYLTLWGMPHHLPPDAGWPWSGALSTMVHDLIAWVADLLGFPLGPGLGRNTTGR